jgi:hypothetical protein
VSEPTIPQIKAWWNHIEPRIRSCLWSKKQWASIAKGLQEDNGILISRIAKLEVQLKAVREYADKLDKANPKDQTNASYAAAQIVDELRALAQEAGETDE